MEVLASNDKRAALCDRLQKLRAAERSQRKKTRVVVLCSTDKVARQLDAGVGRVVAKKIRTGGKQGATKKGGGCASVTEYASVDSAVLHVGDEEAGDKIAQFKQAKVLTMLATDDAAAPLLLAAKLVGLVISFDPPADAPALAARLALAAANPAGCAHVMYYGRTNREKEVLAPLMQVNPIPTVHSSPSCLHLSCPPLSLCLQLLGR